MKLIYLLLLPLLLLGYDNPNITNREYRVKEINKLLDKEKQIQNMVENYLFLTGDVLVTKEKLTTFFNVSTDFWMGLQQDITLSLGDSAIVIDNALLDSKNTLNNEVLTLYKTINKDNTSYINNNKIYIPLSHTSKQLITFFKELPTSSFFIKNHTIDENNFKTKLKLEFQGNGFGIAKYNTTTNQWEKLGEYDFSNKKGIVVDDVSKLSPITGLKNLKAYVVTASTIKEMKYVNSAWVETSTIDISGITPGLPSNIVANGTILNAACSINNYETDSKLKIQPQGEPHLDTTLEFQKKLNGGNNLPYWSEASNLYLISNTFSILGETTLITGKHMFICSPNRQNYHYVVSKNLPLGNKNVIHVPNVNALYPFNDWYDGNWYYIEDLYLYVLKENGVYKSYYKLQNNSIIPYNDVVIGIGTRNAFINETLNTSKLYLTTENDCKIKQNCSGASKYVYGGKLESNLYSWKVVDNELVDIVSSTLITAYEMKYNNFIDKNGITYKKITDNNGNICYKNSNGEFVYKNGAIVPTSIMYNSIPQFPTKEYSCGNNALGKYKSLITTNYQNTSNTYSFFTLNTLNELSMWVPNITTVHAQVKVNNEDLLFSYVNNEWVSKKYVVAKGNRTNLFFIDDGVERVYYSTELGQDILYNNGYYDRNQQLYMWIREVGNSYAINGFVDVKMVDTLALAYSQIQTIFGKIYINGNYYEKITYTNTFDEDVICLKNTMDSKLYTKTGLAVPSTYVDNTLSKVYFPKNITCENIAINPTSQKIKINAFDNLEGFNEITKTFEFNGLEVKIPLLNHFIIRYDGEDRFIVIGDRNDVDITTFETLKTTYTFNNKVYTTQSLLNEDDNKRFIVFTQSVFQWNYLNTPYSVNKLINQIQLKNCKEAYDYYGITNERMTIVDKNGKFQEVLCYNAATVFTLTQLKDYVKTSIIKGQHDWNKDTLTLSTLTQTDNHIVFTIDVPIDFIRYQPVLLVTPHSSLKFNTSYTIGNEATFVASLVNNSVQGTQIQNTNTNYCDMGVKDKNNAFVARFVDYNGYKLINAIVDNTVVKFELINHNLDNSRNSIPFYGASEFHFYHY